MSDPYGREQIPMTPKKPTHFSLWRPIRGAVGGFFYVLLMQFYCMYYGGWKAVDKTDGEALIPMVFLWLIHQVGIPLTVALVCGLGWWSVLAIFGWIGFSLLIFFTFHLDKEESREYWVSKILP